jgi:hypothetical protein
MMKGNEVTVASWAPVSAAVPEKLFGAGVQINAAEGAPDISVKTVTFGPAVREGVRPPCNYTKIVPS